jgi:hypothetical protein
MTRSLCLYGIVILEIEIEYKQVVPNVFLCFVKCDEFLNRKG